MQNFMVQVYVPDKIYQDRVIQKMDLKGESLSLWNAKDFNKFYPGRPWKVKNLPFGVLAVQYMTTHVVRLLVREKDEAAARRHLASALWDLKPNEQRRKVGDPVLSKTG